MLIIYFGHSFAQTDSIFIISKINISGNKITKNKIILKELTFNLGDTILCKNIKKECLKSYENIVNTSLFNFVTVDYIANGENAEINILLVEQWYIWPIPFIEHADRNLSSFIHNKQWDRINYGMFLAIDNFRGRKENLQLKIRLGYKEQYGFLYSKPNIDKKQKHGISIESSYFRQHEVAYKTKENRLLYYRNDDFFVKTSYRATFEYNYRQTLYSYQKLNLQYNNLFVTDSVIILNQNYFGENKSNTEYINLNYSFIKDKRNYIYYPTKGYYFNPQIYYKGLLNKQIDVANITLDVRWYKPISKKWFVGQQLFGKISNNSEQPYFLIEGFGYANYLRAYEYYVIDGNNSFLVKNNLRYNLIKRQNFKVNFIPWEQFNKSYFEIYLNTFFDAGYVQNNYEIVENNNYMTNSWQYSYGIGLDIVTYYDSIFRIEYSINKFGESGFFIHFGSGI